MLNLIDRLPLSSQFAEAQADDEELARLHVDRAGDDEGSYIPRLSEWDPVRAELAVVVDRLSELIALFVAANGGGQMTFAPRPRPVTAVDRVRRDVRRAQHRKLVERVLTERPTSAQEG